MVEGQQNVSHPVCQRQGIRPAHICHQKLSDIANGSQIHKLPLAVRSNAKDVVLKEEGKVTSSLMELQRKDKISEKLYYRIRHRGSQPARLYGLANVHKKGIPVRPILLMPRSHYEKHGQILGE